MSRSASQQHEPFKLVSSVEEDHKKPIFCVTFNLLDPGHVDLFASVGSNRASVYQCLPNGQIELLQAYVDEDPEESFYVCKWSVDPITGSPLLLLAGQNGVVRVLDCGNDSLVHTCAGHGNSINDIAVLPQSPSLFLTASKDESLRLWNLATQTCVLVISGDGGHKNEVLSLDFHPWDGHRFLSSGMDNSVKVWSLAEHRSVVELSQTWCETKRAFPTTFLHRPVFSSVQVHANYVDCVRWLGDLVLSKSVDFEILLWRPHGSDEPGVHISTKFQLLQTFPLPESKMWFVRFSLDASFSLLACGNRQGRVFLYNPHQAAPTTSQLHPLKTKTAVVVRQTAVSRDGNIVVASCEDGTIWRWDKVMAADSVAGPSAGGARASGGAAASAQEEDEEEAGDASESSELEMVVVSPAEAAAAARARQAAAGKGPARV